MASKRRKLKRRSNSPQTGPVENRQAMHLLTYEITDDPISDKEFDRLPTDVKDRLEELYFLAQQYPKEAIPELLALRERHPHIPQIANYLVVAYRKMDDEEMVNQLVQGNFEHHPDYLFARIHYAEKCLQSGDYAKIAEIFDHKFDLKLLYPKRKRFHISEAIGFFGVIGPYLAKTGDREAAVRVYELLKELDPRHDYTKRLKAQLYPGPFRKLLARLANLEEAKA